MHGEILLHMVRHVGAGRGKVFALAAIETEAFAAMTVTLLLSQWWMASWTSGGCMCGVNLHRYAG